MSNGLTAEVRKKLVKVVGVEGLKDDAATLAACAGAVYPTPREEPLCVVRPSGTEQVKTLVELARKEGLNLVPVSSAAPHLKGGSVPAAPGVLVDLSLLDRIVRLDRRNRVALVEPGVTFAALREAAGKEGLRVLAPLAPRPGKSVLASCLEREPFLIPKYHWDSTDPLLCLEVVFGTGDTFRTGSAAGPGSLEDQWALGNAQKNPMGPASSDLGKLVQGAQGTLGVVTWATVKLEVKPSIHKYYFISADDLSGISGFVYEACKRRLGDEMLVLNPAALAALLGGSPEEMGECASRQAPCTLIYAVSGIAGCLPERKVAYQEKDLASIARANGLTIAKQIPGADGASMAQALAGDPAGPYWKSRPRGACQDIFFLTTLDRAPGFIATMREAAARRDYPAGEMGVYVQPLQQGRACHLEFNLFYNPSEEAEAARVHALAREAAAVMAEAGAFFSRPHEPWVGTAYDRCPDTVYALRELKKVFDPDNVLNRGKLCFAGAAGAAAAPAAEGGA
jgi:FAD/FMN-containing dehydrogenase